MYNIAAINKATNPPKRTGHCVVLYCIFDNMNGVENYNNVLESAFYIFPIHYYHFYLPGGSWETTD